jgi:hypothetical protein
MLHQLIEEAQADVKMFEARTAPGEDLRVKPIILLVASCFLWAGMVLGISFLETPVKFTAPSVTLPIGLDVGRHVFGMFNKFEIAWALLSCGLMLSVGVRRTARLPLIAAACIVGLQTVWLLPVLDARVGLILSGQTPPPAPYHLIYVVLEVIKLICLVATGMACLQALTSSVQKHDKGVRK